LLGGQRQPPQLLNFDACSVFNAADPVTTVGGCSYEAGKATSGGWRQNVAVNVLKYKSVAAENSAWGDLKILRRLEAGRKNLSVVGGEGSEAYLQILPNRNVFEAELSVHKGAWHFRLVSVTGQSPSTEALKASAQKIAGKLS